MMSKLKSALIFLKNFDTVELNKDEDEYRDKDGINVRKYKTNISLNDCEKIKRAEKAQDYHKTCFVL